MAKIFVVDDNRVTREMMKNVLELAGYEVFVKSSEKDVSRKIEEALPDIILTGVNSPEMGGVELVKKVRSSDKTRDIVVLAYGAELKTAQMCKQILEAGAEDFIRIPAGKEEILARVAVCFKRRSEIIEFRTHEKIMKRNQEEKEKQYTFLHSVIESLSYPFYVIDVKDYTIKIANSLLFKGDLPEDMTCHKLTHRRDEPCTGVHICPLDKVKETKEAVVVEHIHYDEYGREMNVEVHACPIFNDKGEVSRMIEYSMDITERKKTEEIFKKQLEESTLFVKMATDRENKMIELKREVNRLSEELGKPAPYDLSFL